MRHLLAIPGALVLLLLVWELLVTVTSSGIGFATRRVENGIWRLLLYSFRATRSTRILTWAGGIALVGAISFWGLLLWLGWMLVFSSSTWAIADTTTGEPAGFWARFYFVGFSLATLGVGDFRPVGNIWQVLTALCSLMGLMVVSFAIAYALPIIGAAASKRSLGTLISTLGRTPQDIVLAAWKRDARSNSALAPHLVTLAPLLAQLEEQHVTYPSLHYFTYPLHEKSASVNIAVLDEALTILELGLADTANKPDEMQLRPLREAIFEFLLTLHRIYLPPAAVPPPPSLARLRKAGLPVVDDATFAKRCASLKHRRQLLAALLAADGLSWEALASRKVAADRSEPEIDIEH
ncbi:MAG: ion channel [Myxococcales bacterium]|jgi:hypothetical protein